VYAKVLIYKVIITSFLFPSGKFSLERLQSVLKALDNDTSKLVIDLSCRRNGDTWFVAMNKWQDLTDMELTAGKSALCYPLNHLEAPNMDFYLWPHILHESTC
jgi:phosphoribosylformimino-5-aminoimidazole carboxamide ribonucleotide (ProFAR) isomerase